MADAVHERVLRGIPRWLLVGYLEDLGGTVVENGDGAVVSPGEDLIAGDGWQARLTQMEDFKVGSLSSGRVDLDKRRS